MKESLAHALHTNLVWDDSDHERAIDRLTAFSFGDRLGTLLWRVKYHNCASSYQPAVLLLARHLKTLNRGIAIRISEQALNEWIFAFCTRCLGAKEIKQEELLCTCPECHGSGLRRYNDDERKRHIGTHVPKHIKSIHDIIGEYDRHISLMMRMRLDRL